jgi:hypothetical protein
MMLPVISPLVGEKTSFSILASWIRARNRKRGDLQPVLIPSLGFSKDLAKSLNPGKSPQRGR